MWTTKTCKTQNDEVIEVLCPECKETVLVNDPQAGLDVDDEDL